MMVVEEDEGMERGVPRMRREDAAVERETTGTVSESESGRGEGRERGRKRGENES